MFIKKVRIVNGIDDSLIREVNFHQGMNFIVDMESSDLHNKVGKTTFLKLIDIMLGGKNKKVLFHNEGINNDVDRLKRLIESQKVYAEMILVEDFDQEANVLLRVDLYNKGKRYINSEKKGYEEYISELNIFLFNNQNNVPKFRSLINSFIRISNNNSDFLKNLDRNTRKSYYRAVYNYLFEIADPEIGVRLNNVESELNTIDNSEKKYRKINDISEETAAIEQVLDALKSDESQISNRLNDLVKSSNFMENRKSVNEVRKEYSKLETNISDLELKIVLNNKNITRIKESQGKEIDKNLTHDFFNEMNDLLPDVTKSFNDLVEFNKKLIDNKLVFFEETNADLRNRLDKLNTSKELLVKSNKEFLSLVRDDNVEKYDELNQKLYSIKSTIDMNQEQLNTLNKFSEESDKLKETKKELLSSVSPDKIKEKYKLRMESFNKYFRKYTELVNGERPILTYIPNPQKFPLSINDLDNGSSTGTMKSLMASYDLAYQSFADEIDKRRPNFIVHDVLENVEGDNLKSIVSLANKVGAQFIVAILKEKLDSSGIDQSFQEQHETLKLSKDDKLFEPK
ncbi:hypothetical protein [Companilactobacillus paralimentarius]|uniref:hypothetical protein n=1 Tax=Companilactobacillus paralimentarius TaxID=83526 RepID=UPI0037E031DA